MRRLLRGSSWEASVSHGSTSSVTLAGTVSALHVWSRVAAGYVTGMHRALCGHGCLGHHSSCVRVALVQQRCGLRNLHQYPHARYKSLVKDRLRFSRHWWIAAGNNYELVEDVGHEREATQNFGVYRDDSAKDRFVLSTSHLSDLPPARRLNALRDIMRERWRVRDSNRGFDKARLLLQALECFSELRLSGQMSVFAQLPETDQNTFLQYVEGCVQFAQACVHSHPDAVAMVIRAAQICEEMRCTEKRDEVIRAAELAAQRMDRAYAFARPGDAVTLQPLAPNQVSAEQKLKTQAALQAHFKDKPWVECEKAFVPHMRVAVGRKFAIPQMRYNDTRWRLLSEPRRPESGLWNAPGATLLD